MDAIHKQIRRARRRLILQQFLGVFPWTLASAWVVAAMALCVPKIWAIELDRTMWIAAWIAGAIAAGLLVALFHTALHRRGCMDTALEIDRRYSLKERISSALALPTSQRAAGVGRALVEDATRRIEGLDIRDEFHLQLRRSTWLPLGAAAAAFAIALLIPDAAPDKTTAAARPVTTREQVKRSVEELKKKLAQRQEQAGQQELEAAQDLFQKLRDGADELARREDLDRQQALIKLNDLSAEVAKRREALGDQAHIRHQLERLKNIARGPGEEMLEALQKGDVAKAVEELQRLAEQARRGDLNGEKQEQLARQLEQIQRKMRDQTQTQRQAKQELERRIQQSLSQGDLAGAGKRQRQLDQLQTQDRQMQRLEKLASRFEQAEQALQNSPPRAAAAELDRLASDLKDLQNEMQQLETLDELMNEIADAKSAMSCDQCNGFG